MIILTIVLEIILIVLGIVFAVLSADSYDHELFMYPFENQEIPSYVGIVPIVEETEKYPDIETLDYNYDLYKVKTGRDVEGFILAQNNNVSKYVRMKNGKLQPHHE